MMRDQTSINLYVQPNARCNEIVGFKQGILHIKVSAPPVRGKANKELINFIGKTLGIARGDIAIERGLTSRNKVMSIKGLDSAQVMQRLGGRSSA